MGEGWCQWCEVTAKQLKFQTDVYTNKFCLLLLSSVNVPDIGLSF